ncbi:O-antigen ligase family protein [Roseomonas sp. E05]|uniref:O-antigen ligase family protein n=1 Tax=Roseomonas sp. E05 TaxID=3046310 RepID=UPI0024B945D3|nr:O-antigen ligase family protein [Roseomonas sp. E05]MDJ0391466.1 O-antigen ligase family protein [Roseomonas sp. E05]
MGAGTGFPGAGFPATGGIPGTRRLSPKRVQGAVFFAAVALCFTANAPKIILGTVDDSAMADPTSGDAIKQVLFLGVFALAAAVRLGQGGWRALLSLPFPFVPVLAWFWLSVLWAIDPGTAVRRIAFTSIVIMTITYCLDGMSPRRATSILTAAFTTVLLGDWLAIGLLHHAIHLPGELDQSIVGSWRGIHEDKNEAGGFAAVALILFLHEAIRLRSRICGAALVLLAAVFLAQTHSKTSLAFVVAALAAGFLIDAGFRHATFRRLGLVILVGTVVPALLISWDALSAELADFLAAPDSLTGRVQIWPILTDFAADNLLLGSGYGSFWGIGEASPVLDYTSGWLTTIYQAHNGYLDLLVQTGAVGLALVVGSLILAPLHRLLYAPLAPGVSRPLLASILVFGCLRDLLESSLMDRATSIWPIMVVAYCLLARSSAAAARGGSPAQARPTPLQPRQQRVAS